MCLGFYILVFAFCFSCTHRSGFTRQAGIVPFPGPGCVLKKREDESGNSGLIGYNNMALLVHVSQCWMHDCTNVWCLICVDTVWVLFLIQDLRFDSEIFADMNPILPPERRFKEIPLSSFECINTCQSGKVKIIQIIITLSIVENLFLILHLITDFRSLAEPK